MAGDSDETFPFGEAFGYFAGLQQVDFRQVGLEDPRPIEDDLNAIDADTVTWTEKRAVLAKSIPADLLAQYERIRKRNNGIGVIPVWKAVCSGCHMNIPPQLYNELQRSNDLLSCPNCNRIMYFQNQEKSS